VNVTATIYTGSAQADAPRNRGWLLGHFMPEGDIRRSTDVEIKWGAHPKGDERAKWVTGETRTAMIVLVSGRFRINFRDRSVLLAQPGDYVVFSGVDHSWYAEEESVILGIRWPSIPGYAVQGSQLPQLGHKDLVPGADRLRVRR
jgi:hypothetical protein